MKKRLLATLVAVCILGLTSCGKTPEPTPTPAPHEHTFSDEWKSDETHHWHEATCEHTDEVSNKGEHTYNACGVCETCNYYMGVTDGYWERHEMPSGKYYIRDFEDNNDFRNGEFPIFFIFANGTHPGIEEAFLRNTKVYNENFEELETLIDTKNEYYYCDCLVLTSFILTEELWDRGYCYFYIVIDIPEEYAGVEVGYSITFADKN